MSDLSELQAEFKAHLFSGDPAFATRVRDDERLGAALRLGIYRNAYAARLVEALGNDFEALCRVLGEEGFDVLGRDYVRAHPSTSFTLRWFGRRLSEFLAATPPYAKAPNLAELAAFEWALGEAFDAADVPVAGEYEAAGVPADGWPSLKLRLHPSVRVLECRWNTLAQWRAFKEGRQLPPPEPLLDRVSVLIWREALVSRFRSLAADEAAALRLVQDGGSFAELCAAMAEWCSDDEVALRAASLLKGWLAAGLVAGLAWGDDHPGGASQG